LENVSTGQVKRWNRQIFLLLGVAGNRTSLKLCSVVHKIKCVLIILIIAVVSGLRYHHDNVPKCTRVSFKCL
jgi:hypothetical protein